MQLKTHQGPRPCMHTCKGFELDLGWGLGVSEVADPQKVGFYIDMGLAESDLKSQGQGSPFVLLPFFLLFFFSVSEHTELQQLLGVACFHLGSRSCAGGIKATWEALPSARTCRLCRAPILAAWPGIFRAPRRIGP